LQSAIASIRTGDDAWLRDGGFMALRFPYNETEAGLLIKMEHGAECRRINDKLLTKTFNPEWWRRVGTAHHDMIE
jgi:hypothetical protein